MSVIKRIPSFVFTVVSVGLFACGKIEIKEIQSELPTYIYGDSLIVTQWNIGHFSGGGAPSSSIEGDLFGSVLGDYVDTFESIQADIYSINEYSVNFGLDSLGNSHGAYEVLFSDYKSYYIGPQYRYSCNAIFSKPSLSYTDMYFFSCNQNAQITHTTYIKATDYYFLESLTYWNSIPTIIVSAHLAFDMNNESVSKDQVIELINRYKDNSHVILCGDWNVFDINTFDLFASAGYELANHGRFGDFLTWDNKYALDNIMVKGYTIRDVCVVNSYLSDHKPLVAIIGSKDI